MNTIMVMAAAASNASNTVASGNEVFSTQEFMEQLNDSLGAWGGLLLTFMGIMMVVISVVRVARGLMSYGREQTNWVLIMTLMMVGGALAFGGGAYMTNMTNMVQSQTETLADALQDDEEKADVADDTEHMSDIASETKPVSEPVKTRQTGGSTGTAHALASGPNFMTIIFGILGASFVFMIAAYIVISYNRIKRQNLEALAESEALAEEEAAKNPDAKKQEGAREDLVSIMKTYAENEDSGTDILSDPDVADKI